jgi:hypothetical protein
MNSNSQIREIILKYHRGETLTADEQATLEVEMAQLPADEVWERIRNTIEERRNVMANRPWYVRWCIRIYRFISFN